MRRRIADDDALRILNGRVIRPGSGPKASIAALQWAADKKGLSYGTFTQRLTTEDEARIQAEFETWQHNEEEYEQEIRLD